MLPQLGREINLVLGKVNTSRNFKVNGTIIVESAGLSCSSMGFASSSRRGGHLRSTITSFSSRAGSLITRLGGGTKGGRTRVLRKRLIVLRSPFVLTRVRRTVSGNSITRTTISDVYAVFVGVFSNISSRLAHRHTSSMGSVESDLLHVLLNMGDISVSSMPGNSILVTGSFAPSVASRVGERGISTVVARINNIADRDTVLTHTVNVPTILSIIGTIRGVSSNSVVVTSNFGKGMFASPARRRLRRCESGRTTCLGRGRDLGRCFSGRAIAGSNMGGRICNGVNGTRSTRGMLRGNNRNVNLFEARFLFVSETSLPARRRRCRTCSAITGVASNGRIVVHALSVNKSGTVSCLGVRGRSGPFLKRHTVECYLSGPGVFGVRLHTVLHTTIFKGVGIVLPLMAALSRIHETGTLVRRYGSRLGGRNLGFTSVPINIVVRAPSTTVVSSLLTGRISFFSVNAGSLANCAVTISEKGTTISGLCSPVRPTILHLVRAAVGGTGGTNVPIKVYKRTTTSAHLVPLLYG